MSHQGFVKNAQYGLRTLGMMGDHDCVLPRADDRRNNAAFMCTIKSESH